MPIKVICQSCQKELNAPEKYAGKRVKCPGCQEPLAIPGAAPDPGIASSGKESLPPKQGTKKGWLAPVVAIAVVGLTLSCH